VKVLLADDHPLMRMGMRRILEAHGGFEVVAEASTGAEVLPLIGRTSPDVVLLDLRMPGVDGLGCLERMRKRYPAVKAIVISANTDPEQMQAAFDRGARGYIVKGIEPSELASAVEQAVEGSKYQPTGQAAGDEGLAQTSGLTDRELTVIRAVARGLSNAAIGSDLWITEQTVKFHLTNIYRKLGITNRTEAARWAYATGLVDESAHGVAGAS
jgi:DNA-binding NarL/FixJ family response regulator